MVRHVIDRRLLNLYKNLEIVSINVIELLLIISLNVEE